MRVYLLLALLGLAAGRCSLKDLEVCEGRPTFKGFCPTCKFSLPFQGCTKALRKACAPQECTGDERPIIQDCCLSCKYSLPKCTQIKRRQCKDSMKNLPDCGDVEGKKYDAQTCCPTCKIQLTNLGIQIDENKTCSPDDREKFKAATRLCELGERPQKSNACGMSCKRPRAIAKLLSLSFKGCSKVPQCEENETPTRLEGALCKSCRKKRKTCTKCNENEVCVFTSENGAPIVGASCREKKRLKYQIKSTITDAFQALTAEMTETAVEDMVIEVVNRFCEEPENAERCEKYQQYLFDNLIVHTNKTSDSNINIEVDVASYINIDTRRLLTDEDNGAADVMQDSMAESSDDELQVSESNDDASSSAEDSSSTQEEPSSESNSSAEDSSSTQEEPNSSAEDSSSTEDQSSSESSSSTTDSSSKEEPSNSTEDSIEESSSSSDEDLDKGSTEASDSSTESGSSNSTDDSTETSGSSTEEDSAEGSTDASGSEEPAEDSAETSSPTASSSTEEYSGEDSAEDSEEISTPTDEKDEQVGGSNVIRGHIWLASSLAALLALLN